MARLGTQPFTILVGGVLRHADSGVAIFPHSEAHFDVWLGGSTDRIRDLVDRWIRLNGILKFALLIREHEQLKLVPGHFAAAHPEWGDFHAMLRTFIGLTPGLLRGTAHGKF